MNGSEKLMFILILICVCLNKNHFKKLNKKQILKKHVGYVLFIFLCIYLPKAEGATSFERGTY